MKRLTLCVALAAAMGMGISMAHADTFNYHGSLQDAGKAANGTYDLQLTLYSAQSGGSVVAGPVTAYAVKVKGGNFVTTVDFGPMSTQTSQGWVDVRVKPAGGGDFIALDSRSPMPAVNSACPGAWALDGNAGNPAGSYVGTADSSAFPVMANLQYNILVQTNGAVGIADPYTPFGTYSTAIGYNAGTSYDGSIVTGGYLDTFGTSIRDTTTNQFIIAAAHGVGINTATAADGTALRDELTIAPSPDLPGTNADFTMLGDPTFNYKGFNFNVQPNGFYQMNGLYFDGATLFYDSLLFVNYTHGTAAADWQFNGAPASGAITVGTTASNGNGAFLSYGGTWTNASSRTFKDAFAAIDPVDVLQKLVAMPVKTWFYRGNHDDGQHMGPVAEEFAETFGLGSNEKYIGTVDESGVALAAIQGLNKKVEAENASLKQQNAQLRGSLDAVVSRLDKLEGKKGE